MIEIRPISDLTYNLPEIEKAVEQGKQVFLTKMAMALWLS